MNKIILGSFESNIDDSIQIKNKVINFIKDTDVIIEYTDNGDNEFNFSKGVKVNIYEIKNKGNYTVNNTFNLNENTNVTIIKVNDSENVEDNMDINLNGINSKIKYINKTICTNNEKYNINVYHNKSKTESVVINDGINISGNLNFNVSAHVDKGNKKCILDQKNQIINLTNNKCKIEPNLLIDEYDVSASHSAYIGKCDEKKLFYLMSRGIDQKNAEKLFITGILTKNITIQKDFINNLIKKYWR